MKVTVFRWRDMGMTIAEAVVKRIYELVDERQLTINKISTISGVTQSTVSDIVNGVTSNVKIATIKKLCDGLDISIREFFDSPLFDDLEQELK
jgi:transcriptional regulator with XRE-family HTH domain